MGKTEHRSGVLRRSALVASLALIATSAAAYAQVGPERNQVDSPQRGPIDPPPAVYSAPPPPPPPAGAPPVNVPSNVLNGCGAVAYTADGAFGAAFGMSTCDEAERLAIDACRRESTDKADCSRGVVKRSNTWFTLTFCRNGGDWTTHVSTDGSLAGVNQAAATWASRSKYGSSRCRPVPNGTFHSGGLHARR